MDIRVVREGGNEEAGISREVVDGDGNGTQTKKTRIGITDISRKVGKDGRRTKTGPR